MRKHLNPYLQVSNLEKDIVAPYTHMVPSFADDEGGWESRPTLLFFQGQLQRKEVGPRFLTSLRASVLVLRWLSGLKPPTSVEVQSQYNDDFQ
jgi:hypothetical protein